MSRFVSDRTRRAVILSAGQGKRLRPLTDGCPKCALSIGGQLLIEWQINALLEAGFEHIHPVLGYEAAKVQAVLDERYHHRQVEPIFNPFFDVADNLGSCWMARTAMTENFLLLNGDTLFDQRILTRLLNSPQVPITLAVDRKPAYDDDDMKVQIDGDRLMAVGKDLAPSRANGESIGMLLFRGSGPAAFSQALDEAMREPSGTRRWFLWVIDSLARSRNVHTCAIDGLPWAELDFPKDIADLEALVAGCSSQVHSVKGCL